jgi:hypothetical protein
MVTVRRTSYTRVMTTCGYGSNRAINRPAEQERGLRDPIEVRPLGT